MIVRFVDLFVPGIAAAYVPKSVSQKEYDLSDGSLSDGKDLITGYYSAEALLNDIEYLLSGSDGEIIVLKKVKKTDD